MLSRIQFSLTAGFHYLFPPLSIGLALMIVIMEGVYLKTKDPKFLKMTKFWTNIFGLSFAIGVATGFVQVFAFGNNWAKYSSFVGDVFGSVLAAEGIFAFFLEAGFIGVMLFGWKKVSPKVHYLSTCCVAFGAHFSAIWIVAANSWMQTPTGYRIVGEGDQARALVTDFWAVVFNPSFLDRLGHVILGCWLTGSFVVLSIAAYYYLKGKHRDFSRSCMKLGLWIGGISLLLQLWSADSSARGVAKNQPEKLAAIEGVFDTTDYTPMTLLGYVDTEKEETVGIKVPGLLSLMTYRNAKTPVTGLKEFAKSDRPNAAIVFQSYHLMIYTWVYMCVVALLGAIFFIRKTLEKKRWLLWGLVFSSAMPFIANLAGWFTAEVGRQPWVVWKIMRTFQGVSRSIVASQVVGSLIMFTAIYIALFSLFIFLLNRKVQMGPQGDIGESEYSNPYGA